MTLRGTFRAALLLLVPVALSVQKPGRLDLSEELRWRVERLRATGELRIGDQVVRDRALTLALYESRAYRPLWTGEAAATDLRRALASAADDGLDPEDYHLSALTRSVGAPSDPSALAELDLLSTDALLGLGHDLRFGRGPQWPGVAPTTGWAADDPNAVVELIDLVTSGPVREALRDLRPAHFAYTGLLRGLARLRWIRLFGGWQAIPPGPPMRSDSADDRVPSLRARLAVEGVLAGRHDDTSRLYDEEMEGAVRAFQRRHGLNEDGVVGESTLAALSVPVEQRIDQLRVNLERVRWVGHVLPDTFVAVNIPAARVQLIRGTRVAFESRVVVGRKTTPTPVFSAQMRYVDLNPTWTVPAGIVHEVLGLQRANPAYFRSQGMRLLNASGGEVDPAAVDLSRYTSASFPYIIRQDPGPLNALGRIKLMLPNEYHVYLHDTPERGLFARERRLFSHGCVRIEDPVGLAALVLTGPAGWSREKLDAAIAEGTTRTLVLGRPVPVFVLYWTAAADPDGTLRFHPDVYGYDEAVLRALDRGPEGGTPARTPR